MQSLVSNSMFWDTVKFAIVMICLTVVLYHNASNFDQTELKTMAEAALPLFGTVVGGSMLQKRLSNKNNTE